MWITGGEAIKTLLEKVSLKKICDSERVKRIRNKSLRTLIIFHIIFLKK